MPAKSNEKHFLIPQSNGRSTKQSEDDVEAGSSSSSTGDEYAEINEKCMERKTIRTKTRKNGFKWLCSACCPNTRLRNRHHHHQINRGVRSIARIMTCFLFVPMAFIMLMLYLPLYDGTGSRHVAHHDWGVNISRNVAEYVLPENETTLLEPQHACADKMFLLILVCSATQNFEQRQIIRETWGNTAKFNYGLFAEMHAHLEGKYLLPTQKRLNHYREYLHMSVNQTQIPDVLPVRVLFLVGRSRQYPDNDALDLRLRNESVKYNDLIQEDFIDSYSNLTIKTVLALKWASQRCFEQAAFLMKCDDDTFVNVPNLLHFLLGGTIPVYNDTFSLYDLQTYHTLNPVNRLKRTRDFLTGYAFCYVRPIANVTSKWYMPFYMYPRDRYPTYLSGSAYLMSMDVAPQLYEAALSTPLVYLEDVYITGLCANKASIERVHQQLFGYLHSDDQCVYKGVLTQHYMCDDGCMSDAYAFVTNLEQRCPPPTLYFRELRLRKHKNCS